MDTGRERALRGMAATNASRSMNGTRDPALSAGGTPKLNNHYRCILSVMRYIPTASYGVYQILKTLRRFRLQPVSFAPRNKSSPNSYHLLLKNRHLLKRLNGPVKLRRFYVTVDIKW